MCFLNPHASVKGPARLGSVRSEPSSSSGFDHSRREATHASVRPISADAPIVVQRTGYSCRAEKVVVAPGSGCRACFQLQIGELSSNPEAAKAMAVCPAPSESNQAFEPPLTSTSQCYCRTPGRRMVPRAAGPLLVRTSRRTSSGSEWSSVFAAAIATGPSIGRMDTQPIDCSDFDRATRLSRSPEMRGAVRAAPVVPGKGEIPFHFPGDCSLEN